MKLYFFIKPILACFIISYLLVFKFAYAAHYDPKVEELQRALTLAGFKPGKADGLWGARTKNALKKVLDKQELKLESVDHAKAMQLIFFLWNKQRENEERNTDYLQERISLQDARHLLERVGIGANIKDLKRVIGLTRSEAVSHIINEIRTESFLPLPKFLQRSNPPYWIESDFDSEEEQAFRLARDREMNEYRLWWVREIIETPSPQTERLVLFWHNHFVSAYSAINEQSTSIARQNMLFRELGIGNFKILTKAVIHDPAMLNYLDNDNSEKGKPNENLSRELMELFVLGEGNYTETTVKEGARALTGYSYDSLRNTSFNFNRWNHDNGIKTIFGKSGNFNGDEFVDILFEQPASYEFIVRKFWRHFVSEVLENNNEIAEICTKFKESDFDIRTLYRAILTSKAFWSQEARATIVKSPVDFLLGTIRSTGFLPSDWTSLPNKLAMLGQNLFEHPNVAGWPGGKSWITPSGLLNRSYLAKNFFSSLGPEVESMVNPANAPAEMTKRSISLRYAAEDFQGPPKFTIRLIKSVVEENLKNPFTYESFGVSEYLFGDKWIHSKVTFKDIKSNLAKVKKTTSVRLEGHLEGGDFYGIELSKDTFSVKIPEQMSVYKNNYPKVPGVFFINFESLRDGTFEDFYDFLPQKDKILINGLCYYFGTKDFLDEILANIRAKQKGLRANFWQKKANFKQIKHISQQCLRKISKTKFVYGSTHEAKNGHNTEKLGRIDEDSQLPWQTLNLNIGNDKEFDTVEVAFLNDHCCGMGGSQGGDRNFFVDWVKVDDNLFLASDGTQHGNNCSSEGGKLYCSGWVRMKKSIHLVEDSKQGSDVNIEDSLNVERVSLGWIDRFKKNRDWNELAINLLNPSFNNIHYDALRIKLVRRKNNDLFLMLSSNNCYPDCLENKWPKKTHVNNETPYQKDIKISLIRRNNKDYEAHYWGLNKSHRKFVDALWSSLPQMLEELKSGARWKKAVERKRTDGWKGTLDYILKTLPKTRYVKSVGANPLIVRPPKESSGMMAMMGAIDTPYPYPGGNKPITNLPEIGKSLGMEYFSTLQKLFLATDPVIIAKSSKDIAEIITDPVYNLK